METKKQTIRAGTYYTWIMFKNQCPHMRALAGLLFHFSVFQSALYSQVKLQLNHSFLFVDNIPEMNFRTLLIILLIDYVILLLRPCLHPQVHLANRGHYYICIQMTTSKHQKHPIHEHLREISITNISVKSVT